MPISRVQIIPAFASVLTDTLVDVIPCWGNIWIICTDKIYRFDYNAAGSTKVLAYTFVPASTGELIQCAIGFNGYMYIGTTCPDHASNARVLRLEPTSDGIDDLISNDGTFLTGTAELSLSTATASEHTILGLAVVNQVLLSYYQYNIGTWRWGIYRQSDHATWGLSSGVPLVSSQVSPINARGSKWRLFAGGNVVGCMAVRPNTGFTTYMKINQLGNVITFSGFVTTGVIAHNNIGIDISGFQCTDNSIIHCIENDRPELNATPRPLDALDLWFANYGSSATLNPAFISDADWYGGVPWFGNYFTGLKIVEDDGGGSLTTWYCLAYREPDGDWVISNRTSTTGSMLAPKYTTYLNGELVILAPHAGENNFSIVIPEYTGTIWSKWSGM